MKIRSGADRAWSVLRNQLTVDDGHRDLSCPDRDAVGINAVGSDTLDIRNVKAFRCDTKRGVRNASDADSRDGERGICSSSEAEGGGMHRMLCRPSCMSCLRNVCSDSSSPILISRWSRFWLQQNAGW